MNHDMLRRFAFIETRLFWGGGVTAGELAEAFGIARQNAQQTIKVYQKNHPGQMQYVPGQHRQVPTESFEPFYVRQDVAHFLDYQRAVNHIEHFYEEIGWSDLPFTDADSLIRPIYDGSAVRQLLASLHQKTVVEIDYWSKTKARPRLISPHHLVFADGRYHVRAYCHDALEYRDFVLSRVVAANETSESWISGDDDQDWHRRRDLKFDVNLQLPFHAQHAVRMDFLSGNEDFMIVHGVRLALASYVKRRLCRNDWRFGIPLWRPVDDM